MEFVYSLPFFYVFKLMNAIIYDKGARSQDLRRILMMTLDDEHNRRP